MRSDSSPFLMLRRAFATTRDRSGEEEAEEPGGTEEEAPVDDGS